MGILTKLRQKDNFWIGLIIGIILPLLLFQITKPLDPDKYALIKNAYKETMLKLMPMLLSRCIFPNALIFFLLIWGNFNLTAKGVLYASLGLVGGLIILQIIV